MFRTSYFVFLFLISLDLGANLLYSQSSFSHVLGIMVKFSYEEIDDPLTTGRGTFLASETDQYTLGDTLLCSGFKVDSPSHDTPYFINQISAIQNYYNSVYIFKNTLVIGPKLETRQAGLMSVREKENATPHFKHNFLLSFHNIIWFDKRGNTLKMLPLYCQMSCSKLL